MDDASSQFLIMVGEMCDAAARAGLWVEVRSHAGIRVSGYRPCVGHTVGAGEVDETGYERTVRIGDQTVCLDEIVECTIRRPSAAG